LDGFLFDFSIKTRHESYNEISCIFIYLILFLLISCSYISLIIIIVFKLGLITSPVQDSGSEF
jgi:hypothetical protein